MAIKAKTQKDHYLTEVSVELPAEPKDVDALLRSIKTTGEMLVLYNEGGIIGINFKQKTKMNDTQASELREKLGLSVKFI
jgi:hypothetical protein